MRRPGTDGVSRFHPPQRTWISAFMLAHHTGQMDTGWQAAKAGGAPMPPQMLPYPRPPPAGPATAAPATDAREGVACILTYAEEIEPPDRGDFFNHMYAELPDNLRSQRDTMRTSSIGQDPLQIEAPLAPQA